jgi:DNA-binding CsgD family transcriptional regulator
MLIAGDRAAQVIELAHELTEIAGSSAFYADAPGLLSRLLPAEQVMWAEVDFAAGMARARGGTPAVNRAVAEGLVRYGHTHQGVQSYETRPLDVSPRRLSDVATQMQWHRTPLYNEVYREYGPAYQLGLMISRSSPGVGVGWTFTRAGSDFTDDEVEIAGRLLPVLIAVERIHRASPTSSLAPVAPLKQRERVLLIHLAAGRTARAIGHEMGITERTVRKHLGALYARLGCGDRLVAVRRAAEFGLLPKQPNGRA